MKSRFAVIVFFIFFFAGYMILGYTRHCIYEEEINKSVEKWVTARNEGIKKPLPWEKFRYHGAPEAVPIIGDPMYKEVAYSLHETYFDYINGEYQTEVIPQLLDEVTSGKWNLWAVYNRMAIYKSLQVYVYVGGNTSIRLGPDVPTDVCGSLAESIASWEAAGGKREGNWMEVYKQSPEYRAWLDQWFTEISGTRELEPPLEIDDETRKMIDELIRKALSEGKSEDDPYVQALYKAKEYGEYGGYYEEMWRSYRPMSVEERYRNTTEELKLPFWSSLLCRDVLEADQRLVEVAYERYVEHLVEEDIVRGGIDSGIIDLTGDYLDRTAKNSYNISYVLKTCGFPLTDFFVDVCMLVVSSIVLTICVVKKILPRLERIEQK